MIAENNGSTCYVMLFWNLQFNMLHDITLQGVSSIFMGEVYTGEHFAVAEGEGELGEGSWGDWFMSSSLCQWNVEPVQRCKQRIQHSHQRDKWCKECSTGPSPKGRCLSSWKLYHIQWKGVYVIVVATLYNTTSRGKYQRHSRPNKLKPWLNKMVFKHLWNEAERPRVSSCWISR